MTQLIDKNKIVAEIERKLKNINLNYVSVGSHPSDSDTNKKLQDGISKNLQDLLSFINTLEVKEVDLEKEIMKYQREIYDRDTTVRDVAKHFFELGLKVKQETNDGVKIGEAQIYLEDTMKQPYVGNQLLDLNRMKYEALKSLFKDGDNVEILIRKTQKGE